MTKAIKCGYLLRYKRRLFSRYWREEFMVLYEDSTVAWFKNKSRSEPEGCLLLRDAPQLMAIGEYTMRVPHRPASLPHGYTLKQLMAFGTANRQKVHWFVAKSEDEINDWMTAISNTLPLPPGLPVYSGVDESTSNVYETIDSQHEKTPAAMITPSALAHSQSYAQKMTTTGAVVKQHQLQPQQQQSCSSEPLDSSSSSAATKPNFNSVGEIATGVMLAGCVTSWGWGYGLGWQEPVKHLFSSSSYMDMGYGQGYQDTMDPYTYSSMHGWSHPEFSADDGAQHYYDTNCGDHDFDMDFGGDFGF